MHDTVIRGGTIIDGTGSAAFSGDVAIKAGKLAQVAGTPVFGRGAYTGATPGRLVRAGV